MHPSYQLLFQNLHEGLSDEALYAEELRLAELAEPLGFSAIWCVEHHFDGEYSMCPDNTQLLTYLAARTQDIKLVTAAIIVPWNDPLRVVEKVVLLDYASQGRLVLGLGRGLAKSEYAMFGLDMNEARERFDEATAMILRGLETGIVEGDGPFYRQPRATIRPAPTRGFRDRLVCIAMSPDSIEVAANLKAAMATFVQFPIEQHRPLIETYRARYREAHGVDAPPPTLTEFVYCHADAAEAERVSHEHMQRYFMSVLKHYNLAEGHFAHTNGYQAYAAVADLIREAGLEESARAYADAQTWGTPEQIVEKVRRKREIIGDYHLNCAFSYAGLPFDKVEASMRLFAEQVIPELRRLDAVVPAQATA